MVRMVDHPFILPLYGMLSFTSAIHNYNPGVQITGSYDTLGYRKEQFRGIPSKVTSAKVHVRVFGLNASPDAGVCVSI